MCNFRLYSMINNKVELLSTGRVMTDEVCFHKQLGCRLCLKGLNIILFKFITLYELVVYYLWFQFICIE